MRDAERLNEAQQRRLYASCQYIDDLLCDLEQMFHQECSMSPFPRCVMDLNPAEIVQLQEHIRQIREQLLHALAWQEMSPESPSIPATRVVRTNLSFIDVAIEELGPQYLRGCGTVPEGAVEGLNGVLRDLRAATHKMENYLRDAVTSRETKGREE